LSASGINFVIERGLGFWPKVQHPASRVCSVSKLAGSGFFDGPFKIAVDGKIEHGKVA
jgi:hypothetical protein